ncbi:ABC transporter ATP-binding protein [Nocardioides zeae]|uniref:ABC transporter ATP-binding protein n=1 Tax=Nocardioides imazamoxiresistens TaxID=3231893 RepID=A0ABU3PSK7_9ACTN|nr:ABC transporter ATP-binding protein [Nocardioides zeae]MDT9592208.1 ABC transporter ATP-binding protein [Nocardioides zeae]
MTAILALEEVKVHFGGVKAVDGVSLSLRQGALHALVGPNGSGKTTAVNLMSRLVDPTAGRVLFDGTDVTRVPRHRLYRRGLARTFQGIRLLDDLTVRENVLAGLDALDLPDARKASQRRDRADAALARMEILDTAGLEPSALPYGVQRRVEIARALAGDPRVLLLDEPVAGMSAGERRDIAEVLHRLKGDGLTMLLIEHDLQFVLGLADHLSVLNFGTLLASGEPQTTAALPAVREAFLGGEHVAA